MMSIKKRSTVMTTAAIEPRGQMPNRRKECSQTHAVNGNHRRKFPSPPNTTDATGGLRARGAGPHEGVEGEHGGHEGPAAGGGQEPQAREEERHRPAGPGARTSEGREDRWQRILMEAGESEDASAPADTMPHDRSF